MNTALILAGGFGTRLRDKFPGIPKPLVPIDSIPVLHRCVNQCLFYDFQNILISTFFESEKIIRSVKEKFQDQENITFITEDEPRGTAGALRLALTLMDDDFLILYSDIFADVNLKKLFHFHKARSADFTAVVHPNNHPFDSDIIIYDSSTYQIKEINSHKNRARGSVLPNTVNAAMYVAKKSCLVSDGDEWDIAQDLLPKLLVNNARVLAYETVEYLKDMGSPKRLAQVIEDQLSGKIKSRSDSVTRNAIFLDRDGCINIHNGYISEREALVLEPGVAKSIEQLNNSTYLACCFTNQPVIARGQASQNTVVDIHNYMQTLLGESGAYLDAITMCPHHPDRGFLGEVPSLKIACECRKPKPGMLYELRDKLSLDLSESWVIGDTMSDIGAGKAAGCWTVLLAGGDQKKEIGVLAEPPDFIFGNLPEAIKFILNDLSSIKKSAENIIEKFLKVKKSKILLISGLPRSGKSTISSVIKKEMCKRGKLTKIFSTDYFLNYEKSGTPREFDKLKAERVFEKFDKKKLNGLGGKFYIHESNLEVSCKPLEINDEDYIIIEGETIPFSLRSIEFFHVLVSVNESERFKRFENKYSARGLRHEEIFALYKARGIDLDFSSASADLRVEL